MAHVIKDSLLNALRGSVGKELVFRQLHGKTVVSKYPDMSRVLPSEAQKKQRERMKQANAYASMVCRDRKLRKNYERQLKAGESVFHRAKKDFLNNLTPGPSPSVM